MATDPKAVCGQCGKAAPKEVGELVTVKGGDHEGRYCWPCWGEIRAKVAERPLSPSARAPAKPRSWITEAEPDAETHAKRRHTREP